MFYKDINKDAKTGSQYNQNVGNSKDSKLQKSSVFNQVKTGINKF